MTRIALLSLGLTATLLSGGCGSAPVTQNGSDTRLRLTQLKTDDAPETARKAHRQAAELLRKADRAAATGDTETARRLYDLAESQLDIAQALTTQADLAAQLRQSQERNRSIQDTIDRLSHEISVEEQALAHARLRAHVETVVSDSRRLAAAAEAYRARFKGGKTDEARRAVGIQLLERAALHLETAEAFESLEMLEANAVHPLHDIYTAADEALSRGDLFSVEELCATLVVEAEKLIDTVWKEKSRPTPEALAGALDRAGIDAGIEGHGVWIELGDSPRAGKPSVHPILKKLPPVLRTAPSIVVVVSALPNESRHPIAEKQSLSHALGFAEQLVSLGIDPRTVRARGAGRAAPVPSLAEGKKPSALLLVPVPVI